LDGLTAEAAATLLARRAGVEAAPAVRDLLVERTRGNALALLEMPSALTDTQLAGEEPLPEALPMTRELELVFLDRVRRLPADTQRLLLVAAADDSEAAAPVARSGGVLGGDGRGLEGGEEAGLGSVHARRLESRPPLIRSALYEAATSSDRRAAHGALAEALTRGDEETDRRAWHLAASALEGDEAAVRALEEAARRAEGRGGYAAAARALERAARLTADDAARAGRLVGAARCAIAAGADEQAAAPARRGLPMVDDPLQRAELAQVLGLSEIRHGRPPDAAPRLMAAAREISSAHPAKALELLLDACWAAVEAGDPFSTLEAVRLAAQVEVPA